MLTALEVHCVLLVKSTGKLAHLQDTRGHQVMSPYERREYRLCWGSRYTVALVEKKGKVAWELVVCGYH